jgi:DNA-binding transcriptional LysR family regulator
MDLTQAREVDVAISYGRALERPGVEVLPLGKEQIAPMCSPSLKADSRPWKAAICELTLIDSQLSQVTWRDWFNLNKLQLPQRPRQSFDRGALSISAAVDGLGVALETTRFAERELARGDLVVAGSLEFQAITRENHFFSQRTNERQVEKIRKFKDWLFKELHAGIAPALTGKKKSSTSRLGPHKSTRTRGSSSPGSST